MVENIEDSASGKLVEGIHAIVAEFYSSNPSAEVQKGMLEKVKQGWLATSGTAGIQKYPRRHQEHCHGGGGRT